MGTYDGTVVGTPTFGAAKFSNGLTAVSAKNIVMLPSPLAYDCMASATWTVDLWLKDATTSSIRVALYTATDDKKGNGVWIGSDAQGHLIASAVIDGSGYVLDSGVAGNDGIWHHVEFVRENATTFKLFIDGILKVTKTGTYSAPLNTYNTALGAATDSASFPWPGDIDEVAFWTTARHSTDFTPPAAAYAGTETGLLALYHLESDGTDSKTTATIVVATPVFAEYGPSKLDFSWAAASGGTAPYSYQVQISTNGTDYTDEGAPQSGLTYSDTGLTASSTYYYRIVATDANNVSGTGIAASKATLAAGLKYNRLDLTGAASGRNIMVLIPNENSAKPYSASTPTPLLMYHHGVGETETALLTDSLKATTTAALLDAGYICCGVAAGENWGSQTACNYYPDLYYTVDLYYNLSNTLFLSQSMGGYTGLLTLAQNEVPKVIAWAGIYPACNLAAVYAAGSFTSAINTAYSCDANTYAAKTFGHDPCLKWGKAFRGVPMRFYASESDTTIVKDDNTDKFQPIITTSCSESTIVLCTGNHGDPSHFQPSDLVAFYERALANPVSTSGMGSSPVRILPTIGRIGL